MQRPIDIQFYVPPLAQKLVLPGYMERRNILKNIVFSRILEIRREKRKPKLKDILKLVGENKSQHQKELVIKKLKALYSGGNGMCKDYSDDEKFQMCNQLVLRVKNQQDHCYSTLQDIDLRVTNMEVRRQEREK